MMAGGLYPERMYTWGMAHKNKNAAPAAKDIVLLSWKVQFDQMGWPTNIPMWCTVNHRNDMRKVTGKRDIQYGVLTSIGTMNIKRGDVVELMGDGSIRLATVKKS